MREKGYEMRFSSTTAWITSHLCPGQRNCSMCLSVQLYNLEKGLFTIRLILSSQSAFSLSNGKHYRNWAVCSEGLVARIQVSVLAELTAWYYFKLRFPILCRCQSCQFCFYHFSIYEPSRICSLSIRVHIGYFLSSHLPFFIHFSYKAASILKAWARKKRQRFSYTFLSAVNEKAFSQLFKEAI